MKRHNKARKAIELSAVIILASAILGACAENVQKQKIPAATYMGGKASITGICKELDAAGASHVDLFQEWVADFLRILRGRMQSWRMPGQILRR